MNRKDIRVGFNQDKTIYTIGVSESDVGFITVKNGDPLFVGTPVLSSIKMYHSRAGDLWYIDFKIRGGVIPHAKMNSRNFAQLLIQKSIIDEDYVFETYIAGGHVGVRLARSQNKEGVPL